MLVFPSVRSLITESFADNISHLNNRIRIRLRGNAKRRKYDKYIGRIELHGIYL